MSPFCRIVACPEGPDWCFYLLNDSPVPFDSAVLETVGYEWGDMGNSERVDAAVGRLGPGEHVFLWRDVDGNGAELRMDLALRVKIGGVDHRVGFELPKLYKKRGSLPVVPEVGKPGFVATPNE